jgi:hypothetical protein
MSAIAMLRGGGRTRSIARVAGYAFAVAASSQMLFCRVSGIKNRLSTNATAGTAMMAALVLRIGLTRPSVAMHVPHPMIYWLTRESTSVYGRKRHL